MSMPKADVIGRWVKLKDLETDEIFEYKIVGSAEADPGNAKISNESPVGKALIGKLQERLSMLRWLMEYCSMNY